MIKIKLWNKDADESWERELNKPNYILRAAWSLNEKECFLLKEEVKNPRLVVHARIDRFKILQIEEQPCCLNNENIEAFLILGAKPQIGINLDTIPAYLKGDSSVIDDLFKNIEDELFECLKDQKTIEELYQTIPLEIKLLKSFPKTFHKEPTYYYLATNIETELMSTAHSGIDYWDDFNLCYKVTIDKTDYLVHLIRCNYSSLVRVYSYETKKPINSTINEKIIIELLIFNIWKMYLKA